MPCPLCSAKPVGIIFPCAVVFLGETSRSRPLTLYETSVRPLIEPIACVLNHDVQGSSLSYYSDGSPGGHGLVRDAHDLASGYSMAEVRGPCQTPLSSLE